MTSVWLDYYYWASIRPSRYFSGRCPHCGKWTNAKNERKHYANCSKKMPVKNISKKPVVVIKKQEIKLPKKKTENMFERLKKALFGTPSDLPSNNVLEELSIEQQTRLLSNYAPKTARDIALDTNLSYEEKCFLLIKVHKVKRSDAQRLLAKDNLRNVLDGGPLTWLASKIHMKDIALLLRTLEGMPRKNAKKIASFKGKLYVYDENKLRKTSRIDPETKKWLLAILHKANLSKEEYAAVSADYERAKKYQG